jgi:hypothetical protein
VLHHSRFASGKMGVRKRGRGEAGRGDFTSSHFVKAEPTSLAALRRLGCTVCPLNPPIAHTTTAGCRHGRSLSAGPGLVASGGNIPGATVTAIRATTSAVAGLTVGFTETMLLILGLVG